MFEQPLIDPKILDNFVMNYTSKWRPNTRAKKN